MSSPTLPRSTKRWVAPKGAVATWRRLGSTLIALGVDVPARTVDTPVVEWIEGVDDALAAGLNHPRPVLGVAAEMVRLGVAPDDLVALSRFAPGERRLESRYAPQRVSGWFANALKYRYNHGGLRAAVGWALVDRYDTPWPWVKAGLVEDGWRFAAAGLSVDEARAMIESGRVDIEGLRTLAALRGFTLPVG